MAEIKQVIIDPPVMLPGTPDAPLGEQARQYFANEVTRLSVDENGVGVRVHLYPGQRRERAFTVPWQRVAAIDWMVNSTTEEPPADIAGKARKTG